MKLCAEFDLIVVVPAASPAVQQRYLREHIRAHLIGRDPSLPALKIFVDDYFGPTSVPRGVDVTFASRRGPQPHKVKMLETSQLRPKVRCVFCNKTGTYVGGLDTVDNPHWENGVLVEREVIYAPETFSAANNVIWDS